MNGLAMQEPCFLPIQFSEKYPFADDPNADDPNIETGQEFLYSGDRYRFVCSAAA
jgi:hypothetical protein